MEGQAPIGRLIAQSTGCEDHALRDTVSYARLVAIAMSGSSLTQSWFGSSTCGLPDQGGSG
jgi:vacuolar-type H+-ATPase subunit I/STV1